MFSSLKIYAAIFIITVITVVFVYVKYLQSEIVTLEKNITLFEVANKKNQIAIDKLTQQLESVQAYSDSINKEFQKAESLPEVVVKKFSKHDLARLVDKKPKLIENIINKATKEMNAGIEKMTSPNTFKLKASDEK